MFAPCEPWLAIATDATTVASFVGRRGRRRRAAGNDRRRNPRVSLI
jgi:hypothetical protein